jgi:hypothetical protein
MEAMTMSKTTYKVTDCYGRKVCGDATTIEAAQEAADRAQPAIGWYLVIRLENDEPVRERFLGDWNDYPVV